MYNTGTVTTTANSTKLVGTGTKWLNNINRVSAEQAIQIQIDATVHNNSIQSIQSDTELTLNFPLPAAATGAKYVILTTMVHSVSDAMNKIVSMNGANVQFSDILTRWMTEQGIITVTLPDQTTQQLRTTKEMDKQLDGKFDKSGGDVIGNISAVGRVKAKTQNTNDSNYLELEAGLSGSRINSFRDGKTTSHSIPAASGTLMQVGDYGWGGSSPILPIDTDLNTLRTDVINRVYTVAGAYKNGPIATLSGIMLVICRASPNTHNQFTQIVINNGVMYFRHSVPTGWGNWIEYYSTVNTTKDSNGNLKAASPVIKVFSDHIEVNEESEGVELEKLETGRYKLKGTLGMNADASWGGYHGGIVIPNGINNLPLVWADFKVLADGDIIIETKYRKHALPPSVLLNRLITYPEFMDEKGNEIEDETPCDIPNGHWIDVRVNMPSNSIYNQKQAEAERLAKIEAERLAQEEAKRAAEEAERAEQEAAERKPW